MGKYSKNFKSFLTDDWQSIFAACELFEELAVKVANKEGLIYNEADGENTKAYLRNVKAYTF